MEWLHSLRPDVKIALDLAMTNLHSLDQSISGRLIQSETLRLLQFVIDRVPPLGESKFRIAAKTIGGLVLKVILL